MNTVKKILLFCLGASLCMSIFNACGFSEKRDKRRAVECFESIVKCVNEKDEVGFRELFNSVGSAALKEADIELLFSKFSSGITANESPADKHVSVTDWVSGDSYSKNISWGREIINNETGERFILSVLDCTDDWTNEDLGIILITLCSVDNKKDFDNWWSEFYEDELPNGMILYGFDD